MMRIEDYDVTDFLAGMLDITQSEDEEEQESVVMFDEDSFFEAVEQTQEGSYPLSSARANKN